MVCRYLADNRLVVILGQDFLVHESFFGRPEALCVGLGRVVLVGHFGIPLAILFGFDGAASPPSVGVVTGIDARNLPSTASASVN